MPKKTKQHSASGIFADGLNLGEIERLLAFMQTHSLEEFEYQRGNLHIRLRKASASHVMSGFPAGTQLPAAYSAPVAQPQSAPVAATAATPAQPHQAVPAPADDLHVVKSPIVGTFYSSPSPEAAPFVTVGSRVDSGQVLCIIEAMKLMNEIESDVSGEIARIFVENGQPVEYGEPLFGIRASGKK